MSENVPVSLAERTTWVCPVCGEEAVADVWVLVDVVERPDLMELGRAGRLRHHECSRGHAFDVEEPLLVYSPGESPPLYLVLAKSWTDEAVGVRCRYLVGVARQRLGAAWDESAVQEGIPWIPWAFFAVALTEGLQAAVRRWEQWSAEWARFQILQKWRRATDSADAQRALAEYPQLLDEEWDTFLAESQETARARKQSDEYALLEERRALLRRCREVGVGPALAADDEFQRLLGVIDEFHRPDTQAERAEHLRRALALISRDRQPQLWATLHHELGYSLSLSRSGVRADNFEEAIAAYTVALEVRPRDIVPDRWARTQSNLGGVFADRIHGNRTENLERAIAAYSAALEVLTREAFPREWAQEQHNLGTVLAEIGDLGRPDNFQRAIDTYTAALEVRTREAFPREWAKTQNSLGNAYASLPSGNRSDNLDRAILAHRAALEVFRRDVFPDEWASVQNNLGTSCLDYPGEGRAQKLEEAIAAFTAALEVHTRRAFPNEWVVLQNNLADAYAARVRGTRVANLQLAVRLWQELIDDTHASLPLSLDPHPLTVRAARVLRRLVPAFLELGCRAEVVTALEQGRAVGLRGELARTHRTPIGLTEEEQHEYRELAARAREIPSERRRLEDRPLGSVERLALLAELGQQHEQTRNRLRELEQRDPEFALTAPTYGSVLELAREHALTLVYLQPMDDVLLGTLAFVVHPASPPEGPVEDDAIRLDGLSRRELSELLIAVPAGTSFGAEHAVALVEAGLQEGPLGWMVAYALTQLSDGAHDRDRAIACWRATMERILTGLGRTLTPLVDRLRKVGARRVVLSISGRLALLPVHATPVVGSPVGAAFFGDEFLLSYAPSASSLSQCLRRALSGRRGEPTLAALGNPDGSLPFATEEVLVIASRFGNRAQVAPGATGTRSWLDKHAAAGDYLELATHARFLPEAPSRASMTLAPSSGTGAEASLALDDLWGGRFRIREGCVVTASACETAQGYAQGDSDESLGFPAAFLGLGASSVIASLWAVNDLATALLVDRIYEHILDCGCSPTAAVQSATRALRCLARNEVRQWLELRRTVVEEELVQFETPQGGFDPERHAAEEAFEDRLANIEAALAWLDDQPDPPFAHPVFWAAFAAYGA